MRTYRVDFEAFHDACIKQHRHEEAMEEVAGQLVARYHLRDLDVLGLGSGVGSEEYWLWRLGRNRLTIVDIDEHQAIEPILKRMPEGGLTYHIGSAEEFFDRDKRSGGPAAGSFGVIFISGLTPDVLWRGDVMKRHSMHWPRRVSPFHDIVMQATRRLKPGGVLINQCFGYGVDAVYNNHFLPAAKAQLAKNGLRMLEVYRMAESIGVNMFVAQKEPGKINLGPPVKRIHARAANEVAELIWPTPHWLRVKTTNPPNLARMLGILKAKAIVSAVSISKRLARYFLPR